MATLKNYHYDIIALSETLSIGQKESCNGHIVISGGETHSAGVRILMSTQEKTAALPPTTSQIELWLLFFG